MRSFEWRQNCFEADAPSTALSRGPLPRFAGQDEANVVTCVIASATGPARSGRPAGKLHEAIQGGLRKNLDCFVVIAPRNDRDTGARERRENDFIYPPPHEVRGRGTTRRVVEGAYGVEASLEADAPSTALWRGPPSPLRGAG